MSSRACGAAAVVLGATLACNKGLEPALATTSCPPGFVGVCGTVTFQGTVPDSTDQIYVLAYDTFPKSQNDLFKFKPSPPRTTLPLAGPPYFYTVPLPAGRYEWVLAVWKKVGTLTPANADTLLREAGFYRDKSDPATPAVVTVPGGTSRDSIDFVVDFGKMHRVCWYFPPCP